MKNVSEMHFDLILMFVDKKIFILALKGSFLLRNDLKYWINKSKENKYCIFNI